MPRNSHPKIVVILSEALFLYAESKDLGVPREVTASLRSHKSRAFGTHPYWGLWAIVWEKDFDEIDDCWDSPGREKTHGPFKAGWQIL